MKNKLLTHFLLAIGVILLAVLAAHIFLNIITRHGDEFVLPDLTTLSVEEAEEVADDLDMLLLVVDSTYVRGMEKGAICQQNPPAGSMIKKGRKVRVVINSVVSKQVDMPNLVGYSTRQAIAELSVRSLGVNRLVYVDDMATNNVIGQRYRGAEITPGAKIEADSKIDLILGLNPSDNTTIIPNLVGLVKDRAVAKVHDSYLNVRRLVYDSSVETYIDSTKAIVYRQLPLPSNNPVLLGEEVTLYLSIDEEKVGK